MRYFFIAIAIVTVVAIAVPTVYNAVDPRGEFANASPSLSTPPTPLAESPRDPNATPRPTSTGTAGGGGQQIAARSGCTACHSINGSDLVGPTWQGLAGHSVTLANGSTVTADDAYLEESIVSPNAKVVEGFEPGIMPQDFGTRLTPEEIQSLIAYIKTLQ
jgi:cytochrome c oxidase subunit 2